MALARHSTDLIRSRISKRGERNTIPFPVSRTLPLRQDDVTWHDPRHAEKAQQIWTALEAALEAGRARKAGRLRASWLHTLHLDRLAWARMQARDAGLRLDPMGRGPVVDRATVHYRDRLPWVLTPLSPYDGANLPERAASIVDAWNVLGEIFDEYIVADEPATSSLRTHCLIGAISPDGRTAEWFVLDRWAS